jgi:hypothetical protein
MMNRWAVMLLAWAAGPGVAALTVAHAADRGYLGAWTITGAVVAPWADGARKADAQERRRLLGRSVVFQAHGVMGPQPLGCPGAHYQVNDLPAGMLFQGEFDEMRSRDKRVDPGRLAAGLGFKGPRISTLETGCEIDFHFVDPSTAEFGLNDYVYTLKRR